MKPMKNYKGQRQGRLTFIRIHHQNQEGRAIWFCKCDCGNTCLTRRGGSKSCGCIQREFLTRTNPQRAIKHGLSKSPEYAIWSGMLTRCYNPSATHYADYGGRGIKVCKRWRGEQGFQHFYADMGPRPEGKSLDRKNNNGNYTPSNCKWSTQRTQALNRRPKRWWKRPK